MNIYVRDASTGATIAAMSADRRGNTDESWSRTLNWLVRNRLLAPGYELQWTRKNPYLKTDRAGHEPTRTHHSALQTGFDFSEAVFNLDATANGSATINAFDQSGTLFSFLLPLSGSGQKFLYAYDGGRWTNLACSVHK
jgi:Protein of unknown function (DUF2380)